MATKSAGVQRGPEPKTCNKGKKVKGKDRVHVKGTGRQHVRGIDINLLRYRQIKEAKR